jgi:hypothetical protein
MKKKKQVLGLNDRRAVTGSCVFFYVTAEAVTYKDRSEALDENCVVVATATKNDELNFPRREDWLAEVFVAEVGDGLLVQVGVVGVEGVAEGGVHGWGCGDAIEEAADVADAA